ITPVEHGGRRSRWAVTLALHVVGAAIAAAALGAALGAAGSLLGAPWGRAGAGIVAAIAGAYALGELSGIRLPVPELRRQVPEWWRSVFSAGPAAFLYGLGLGIGFLTYLRHGTLVAVAAAAAVLGDPLLGVALVMPFGVARSVVVASVWRATSEDGAGAIGTSIERLGAGPLRRWANGLLLAGVAMVAAVTPLPDAEGSPAAMATAVLAGTFAWAAVAKASRPATWDRALGGYALPAILRRSAVVGVPVAEAAVAGLLLGGEVRAGAAMASGLVIVFSLAVLRRRRRGVERLPCGCFGGSRERSIAWILARNATVLVLGAAVAVWGRAIPVPRPPSDAEALPAALVVGGAILTLSILGRAVALWPRRPQTTG
ncbi:MAG: hypothetical protein M3135_08660, partial [Actinomycetota bacterium]|nr:hypothetical protein [Actinomycetota bacterium]